MCRAPIVLLAALVMAACSEDRPAAIDAVVVEGEPPLGVRVDVVRVTIVRLEAGSGAGRVHEVRAMHEAGRMLPVAVRLRPESAGDVGRALYRVRAEGLLGERVVVGVQNRVTFVAGRTTTLLMRFAGTCESVECGADSTCVDGVCVSDLVPECELVGGCDGGLDASPPDGAIDADTSRGEDADEDADAGVDADDAGADGDAGCATDEDDCDDGLDDDCDGTRDCDDPDCSASAVCEPCIAVSCTECTRCVDGACVPDPGAACAAGTCVGTTCCSGCVSEAGGCAMGTTASACGTAGEACEACPPCTTCSGGDCVPAMDGTLCESGRCYAGTCCIGCWDATGGACVEGTTTSACGRRGEVCETCECTTDSCSSGDCRIVDSVASVAAGYRSTSAVRGGELWRWGFEGTVTYSRPTALPSADSYFTIANGLRPDDGTESHRCAIGSRGLVCWGEGSHGELGLGTTSTHRSPMIVDDQSWATVAVGGANTCALRSATGELYCWGYNGEGRVGLGTSGGNVLVPTVVQPGTSWSTVAVGEAHSFAVRADRTLWAWGNDAFYRLGNGTATESYSPTQIGAGTEWREASAGSRHACALEVGGALHCWGWNEHHELGLGPTTDWRDVPARVGTSSWSRISAGDGFTCGITSSQELHCWGRNDSGQLGVGDVAARDVPTRVGTLDGWTDVSAGQSHTCAIRQNGLYCFGSNDDSVLGVDTGGAPSGAPVRVCF